MTATIVSQSSGLKMPAHLAAGAPAHFGDSRDALLSRIETFIREQDGNATYTAVSQQFRLKATTTRHYMSEMRRAGRVRHAIRQPLGSRFDRAVRWEIGAELPQSDEDGVIRRVVKDWPPHMVRHPMDIALFGAPVTRNPRARSNEPRCVGCHAPEGERHGARCVFAASGLVPA